MGGHWQADEGEGRDNVGRGEVLMSHSSSIGYPITLHPV